MRESLPARALTSELTPVSSVVVSVGVTGSRSTTRASLCKPSELGEPQRSHRGGSSSRVLQPVPILHFVSFTYLHRHFRYRPSSPNLNSPDQTSHQENQDGPDPTIKYQSNPPLSCCVSSRGSGCRTFSPP